MHYFIITGASSGLGKETAKLLLRSGHHVISVSRKAPAELELPAKERGRTFTHLEHDLTRLEMLPEWLEKLMHVLEEGYSQPASVCLIHCAANAAPFKPLDGSSPEEIEQSLNLNLIAPTLLSSLFIQRTKAMPIRKKLVLVSLRLCGISDGGHELVLQRQGRPQYARPLFAAGAARLALRGKGCRRGSGDDGYGHAESRQRSGGRAISCGQFFSHELCTGASCPTSEGGRSLGRLDTG